MWLQRFTIGFPYFDCDSIAMPSERTQEVAEETIRFGTDALEAWSPIETHHHVGLEW